MVGASASTCTHMHTCTHHTCAHTCTSCTHSRAHKTVLILALILLTAPAPHTAQLPHAKVRVRASAHTRAHLCTQGKCTYLHGLARIRSLIYVYSYICSSYMDSIMYSKLMHTSTRTHTSELSACRCARGVLACTGTRTHTSPALTRPHA